MYVAGYKFKTIDPRSCDGHKKTENPIDKTYFNKFFRILFL